MTYYVLIYACPPSWDICIRGIAREVLEDHWQDDGVQCTLNPINAGIWWVIILQTLATAEMAVSFFCLTSDIIGSMVKIYYVKYPLVSTSLYSPVLSRNDLSCCFTKWDIMSLSDR